MTLDLAKLRAETLALIDGTTQGPWMRVGWQPCGIYTAGDVSTAIRIATMDRRHEHDANARLIAAAPTLAADTLRLLDEIERLAANRDQGSRDYCDLMKRHDAHFSAWQSTKAKNERLTAENERMRGLLWYAWHEFNAIRARSGSPLSHDGLQLVAEDYWDQMTDAFAEAIGPDATTPWASPQARAALTKGGPDDR